MSLQKIQDSANAYESNAVSFLKARDSSRIGANVVKQWANTLRSGASIVELGCGGGLPVTQVLHSLGFQINAIESSPTLVKEFQRRFPEITIECCKVQQSAFFNQTFDAAIAIGLVFLLPEKEQLELIANVAKILPASGRFLFTAPVEKGSWTDINTGSTCWSLGSAAYEDHFKVVGFELLTTYIDSGQNNYYDIELIA